MIERERQTEDRQRGSGTHTYTYTHGVRERERDTHREKIFQILKIPKFTTIYTIQLLSINAPHYL